MLSDHEKCSVSMEELTNSSRRNDLLIDQITNLNSSNEKLQLELAKYKYQFLSEQQGWTDRKTNLSSKQETISIKVLAKELPLDRYRYLFQSI